MDPSTHQNKEKESAVTEQPCSDRVAQNWRRVSFAQGVGLGGRENDAFFSTVMMSIADLDAIRRTARILKRLGCAEHRGPEFAIMAARILTIDALLTELAKRTSHPCFSPSLPINGGRPVSGLASSLYGVRAAAPGAACGLLFREGFAPAAGSGSHPQERPQATQDLGPSRRRCAILLDKDGIFYVPFYMWV
ncbi:hypothetical protein B296_00007767 [Ensete ventricosum]|uniref:Uncharacterized protein n=1 Tax=Ensete ventricosum TaxID=4639 RepID=A0A427AQ34_ENSVE|nr:hypothetical protein B296_00007767 [Ensete ventricosum]